ncbi:CPBP family intramembrane glutamic endopeptidase [Fulvivirga kasyanovii]|uniref:CPBP family intramembrane metalloprotease n=1 Tax=Fulvivirga kasyanovii TaxID=396812 RepID=A0ABW9RLT4_9BACT|nr:CPBP family intramembrane metalloprotease [Fulvivirga kasyanovii]
MNIKSIKSRLLKSRSFCIVELLFLFVAIPLFTKYQLKGFYNLVPLLVVAVILLVTLLKDQSFHNRQFVRLVPVNWKLLITRFLIISAVIYIAIRVFQEELLYYLPQEKPEKYLLAIALYPLWSVIPQEIVYRAWYYHRYSELFPNVKLAVFVNSLLFGFTHIVFDNWIAVSGAFAVSFIFSHTYRKYNSLLTVIIEHFFYGVMIFSLGLGKFFR